MPKRTRVVPKPRPSIFIISSTENGLQIAKAIQANLSPAYRIDIWNQGTFQPGDATLEALAEKADQYDFAIGVFTPDDTTQSRGKRQQAPRDNVLLELGLFIGVLGRKRAMVVYDRTSRIKIPSDLAGVTPATFQLDVDANLRAAVGEACTQIEGVIESLGPRKRPGPEPHVEAKSQTPASQLHVPLLSEGMKRILRALYDEPHGRLIVNYVRNYRNDLDSLVKSGCVQKNGDKYKLTQLGVETTGNYFRATLTTPRPTAR
jgi:hypothetical protein